MTFYNISNQTSLINFLDDPTSEKGNLVNNISLTGGL